MTGRKAKPLALNKKNLTKKEIKQREEAENLLKFNDDLVIPPDWLEGEYALEEWHRVTKEFKERKLITNVDLSAFAFMCQSLQIAINAKEDISKFGQTYTNYDKEGNVKYKKNPSMGIFKEYSNLYKSFCSEFGMTPSARIKLTLPTIEIKEEESPLKKLINLKNGS